MPSGLSKLWARLTGLKNAEQETTALHNVVGDETPPPGVRDDRVVASPADDGRSRGQHEEEIGGWQGEEPGH